MTLWIFSGILARESVPYITLSSHIKEIGGYFGSVLRNDYSKFIYYNLLNITSTRSRYQEDYTATKQLEF
jgi:hypothetical protein